MKNPKGVAEKNLLKFLKVVANKMQNGFKVIERNDKLPFAVLLKEGKEVDHNLNFMIFCATFGLWTLPWIYKSQVASKPKMILVAIDEDGNTFEEKCYSE
jgi:hypothetical protein